MIKLNTSDSLNLSLCETFEEWQAYNRMLKAQGAKASNRLSNLEDLDSNRYKEPEQVTKIDIDI